MAAPKGNKYAKGNKGGRPTKFKPEFVQKLISFFDIEPYKERESETSKEYFQNGTLKKESKKTQLIPNRLPTLYQFARSIKVSYWTVWDWANKGEDINLMIPDEDLNKYTYKQREEIKTNKEQIKEFSNAYKEAKELQKEFLITIGLAGASPSAFAIFTAKNVTDMRDKIETDITSQGERISGFNYIKPSETDNSDNQAST